MRQVYNKTRTYLEWLAARLGGGVTIVDDGDMPALSRAIRPETRFVFAETFTNPLVRAQDLDALRESVVAARATAPEIRLVIDSTIATPWAFKQPLLDQGVDVVVGSGTKSLGGHDTDLWGYVATRDAPVGNSLMDLLAMRGGMLDWRRATAILSHFDAVDAMHARRCASAARDCRVSCRASAGERGLPPRRCRIIPIAPPSTGTTCATDRWCRSA